MRSRLAALERRLSGSAHDEPGVGPIAAPTVLVRVLSALFIAGASIALASMVFPQPPGTNEAGLFALYGVAYLIGGILLVARNRLPSWAPFTSVACGTALVTGAIYFSNEREGAYAMFYVWISLFSFFFFTGAQPFLQVLFIAVAYALALAVEGTVSPEEQWVITIGTITVAGLLTGFLKGRVERLIHEARGSEERLQAIMDNAPALVYAKDLGGAYLFVNRGFEQHFGLGPNDAGGKTDHDLFPSETADAFRANDRRVLEAGTPITFEEVADHDGDARTYTSIKFPLLDPKGSVYGVCGISTDVTERKRIEAELARKEEAERSSQAKTEFLSRVSHELRTPLNAILGFAQLLEMADLPRRDAENVEQIVKGGRHLLNLINELLEISRIEAGNMTISPEPIHVGTAVASALDLARPLAAERAVRLENRLGREGDFHVQADNQRLSQVLLNLLSNAIKYNREGGSVTVSAEQAFSDHLRVLVSDTGRGIPEEKLAKLFSPFERLGAESTSIEGTGLGLALSKLLVEVMGGTLSVESEVGIGTTFSIELATADAPTVEGSDTAALSLAEEWADRSTTILLIEDNLSSLKLVERVFADRPGVRLLAAMDGQLGLELARKHLPDLVLLDLHLPGIPGDEVLERLKRSPETHGIPVVVTSADTGAGRMTRLLASGARAYLTKPLDIKRLLEVVDESVSEAHAGSNEPETGLSSPLPGRR